jgi:alpha-1,4-galacturonosyltransferase
MKPTPSQRRRGPRAALLALVLCSLLVPLAFIFDRAPSGTSSLLANPLRLPPADAPVRGSANAALPVDLGASFRPIPSAVFLNFTNRLLPLLL